MMNIIGDVKGKKIVLVDDMIDTAGTFCKMCIRDSFGTCVAEE